MSGLLSRVLVTATALPPVLLLAYLGGWWIVGLGAAVAVVALHEFYVMTRPLRPVVLAGYSGAFAAILGARLGGVDWTLAGFLATFVFAFLFKALAGARPTTVSVASTVLGAGWIGLGLAHLVLVREIPAHGALALLTVLLAAFAADTAAYFAGRLLGRHRLAPETSPGKTWEGFVAGAIAAVLVPFFAMYEEGFLDIPESLALGGAIALAGPVGDLFESALKRDMQIKDAGRLLAGHGGMLDRIDSLLFAGIVSYYLLAALGQA